VLPDPGFWNPIPGRSRELAGLPFPFAERQTRIRKLSWDSRVPKGLDISGYFFSLKDVFRPMQMLTGYAMI